MRITSRASSSAGRDSAESTNPWMIEANRLTALTALPESPVSSMRSMASHIEVPLDAAKSAMRSTVFWPIPRVGKLITRRRLAVS